MWEIRLAAEPNHDPVDDKAATDREPPRHRNGTIVVRTRWRRRDAIVTQPRRPRRPTTRGAG
jgi:hypothetical protein